MKKWPNFLIIGASKSGTSSLYQYLRQHPDIYLSGKQKEGRFFSQMKDCFHGPGDEAVLSTVIRDQNGYANLFDDCKDEKAIGDISPDYLYFFKNAISLIHETLGKQVRIIIILRNPIDRAFSAYTHFKRDLRETLSFEEALEKEPERAQNKWLWAWQYKHSGFYSEQVEAWLSNFQNVKVILYDDMLTDQDKVLKELCAFIGVDPDFSFDTTYKYNVSGEPKSQVLYKLETSRGLVKLIKKILPAGLVTWIKKNFTGEKQMVKSEMNPETKRQLIEFFRKDIKKLEKLIGRDLSAWLQV